MTRTRILLLACLAVSLSSCDSNELYVPEGPVELGVHLQYNFEDDQVVVELDGKRVFIDRVTTEHVLSLATVVELSVEEGEHEVRLVVNGVARASKTFDPRQFPILAVTYDGSENDVDLTLHSEPIYYD